MTIDKLYTDLRDAILASYRTRPAGMRINVIISRSHAELLAQYPTLRRSEYASDGFIPADYHLPTELFGATLQVRDWVEGHFPIIEAWSQNGIEMETK